MITPMKNKYIVCSQISEKKIRVILRYFLPRYACNDEFSLYAICLNSTLFRKELKNKNFVSLEF